MNIDPADAAAEADTDDFSRLTAALAATDDPEYRRILLVAFYGK